VVWCGAGEVPPRCMCIMSTATVLKHTWHRCRSPQVDMLLAQLEATLFLLLEGLPLGAETSNLRDKGDLVMCLVTLIRCDLFLCRCRCGQGT